MEPTSTPNSAQNPANTLAPTPAPAPASTPVTTPAQTPSTLAPEPSMAASVNNFISTVKANKASQSSCEKKDGTPKPKKEKKTSRAGAANYSDDDVQAMLDIAEDIEPLGANNWSEVANQFCKWAKINLRPARDFESLRNKFDKLANAKKKTGDPSCPPNVRRAKYISRAIQAKCAAFTLDESEEENQEVMSSTGAVLTEENDSSLMDDDISSIVGARKRKRKTGATGTTSKNKKSEDILLEHVGAMTEHIGSISKVLLTESGGEGDQNQLKKEDVVEIVQREVRDTMRATNEMLEKMMDIIRGKSI